jgi:hypothetical protein
MYKCFLKIYPHFFKPWVSESFINKEILSLCTVNMSKATVFIFQNIIQASYVCNCFNVFIFLQSTEVHFAIVFISAAVFVVVIWFHWSVDIPYKNVGIAGAVTIILVCFRNCYGLEIVHIFFFSQTGLLRPSHVSVTVTTGWQYIPTHKSDWWLKTGNPVSWSLIERLGNFRQKFVIWRIFKLKRMLWFLNINNGNSSISTVEHFNSF